MDKGNKKDARRLHISCFESFDEMYFLRYPSESPFRGLSDRPFGSASAQNNTRTYVTTTVTRDKAAEQCGVCRVYNRVGIEPCNIALS